MKPNKPFCYSVFFDSIGVVCRGHVAQDAQEELFCSLHESEAFASLCENATVIDNFSGAIVGVWQSGREVE